MNKWPFIDYDLIDIRYHAYIRQLLNHAIVSFHLTAYTVEVESGRPSQIYAKYSSGW